MSATSGRKWSLGAKLIISGAVLLTLLVGRFFFCHLLSFTHGYARTQFDSSAWKSNWTCECTAVRMQMAENLLATHDLKGKSKDEVGDLLGAPDRHAYIQQYEKPGDFVYHLAPHPMVDDYWLVVRFDADGRVAEAAIVMD